MWGYILVYIQALDEKRSSEIESAMLQAATAVNGSKKAIGPDGVSDTNKVLIKE